jgi:hypothetical protein
MTAEENDEVATENPGGEDPGSADDDDEVKSRKRRERLEQNRVSARESRKRVSECQWNIYIAFVSSPHPSFGFFCNA